MMHLFDNHNHSQFSFDGKRSSVEECACAAQSAGLSGIAFTDHCDFFVPAMKASYENLVPEVFDVPEQQEEIDRVQALIDRDGGTLKLLKGIEVGMHENHHDDIRRTLAENSFDQVIGSIHYVGDTDPYFGGYYEDKDWKTAYGGYLETLCTEMKHLEDFDIMGHYDYIVRYWDYEQTDILYKDFSDIFDEMFRYLIHNGKALEINTKSYQNFNGRQSHLDTNVLARYREMGGEIISFGSDSHDDFHVGLDFAKYAAIVKSLGFRWCAHYEKRKLVQLPL